MGEKTPPGDHLVCDSGLAESSVSIVQQEPESCPPDEGQSSLSVSKISDGVVYYSDSSHASGCTDKASTGLDTERWSSSVPAVPTSASQQSHDVNLEVESSLIDPDQESHKDRTSRATFLPDKKAKPDLVWKDHGMPTLDSYEPARASPPPVNVPPEKDSSNASFTVGSPNTIPQEEEDVESSSTLLVQKPEPLLTGDDQKKNKHLEAQLRNARAKAKELEKKLASSERKTQETEEKLRQANEEIKRLTTEKEREIESMRQENQREVDNLKTQLAAAEKKTCDQEAKYCEQIRELDQKLVDQEAKYNKDVLKLTQEKCKLEVEVANMKTEEQSLKRQLSETKLTAERLQWKLEKEAHEREREAREQAHEQEKKELKQKREEREWVHKQEIEKREQVHKQEMEAREQEHQHEIRVLRSQSAAELQKVQELLSQQSPTSQTSHTDHENK